MVITVACALAARLLLRRPPEQTSPFMIDARSQISISVSRSTSRGPRSFQRAIATADRSWRSSEMHGPHGEPRSAPNRDTRGDAVRLRRAHGATPLVEHGGEAVSTKCMDLPRSSVGVVDRISARPDRRPSASGSFLHRGSETRATLRPGSGAVSLSCAHTPRRDPNRDGNRRPGRAQSHRRDL